MEFEYDGGGLAKGGMVVLFLDGTKVGEGRVDKTSLWYSQPTRPVTSAFKPAHPRAPDYGPTGNRFSGEVNWVEIDIGKDAEKLGSPHFAGATPARRHGAPIRRTR